MFTQRGKGNCHHRSLRREQIRTAGNELTDVQRHRGAEPSTGTVALHRGTEPTADGVRHPRWVVGSIGEETQRDGAGSPPAGPREGLERRTVADAPDQAERRFRPRARRARSTARPPLVRMRRRKPWVLARLRLLGWYVRFNEEPPRGGRARPEVGDHAGGGNRQVYGRDRPVRNAEGSLGKTPEGPCRTRMPVLRCAPRAATARRSDFPGVSVRDPADLFEHLYHDLHTCGCSCGQLPATADAPGSGNPMTAPMTAAGGREKNGER